MTTTVETESKNTTGQDLYRRAKKIIPGGTQLLSKRPEMYLPDNWPAYYSRAKGCRVWDMDGRELIDMNIMGVGACLLGYADDEVDQAVKDAVDRGNMCTLNAPEEVELAELLCEVHPWASMVRYARSGGESMAVAVRIARAFTNRQVVAVCGYHGWSDWYLAANLASGDVLDGHLLPGLAPAGVPRNLAGTTLTFHYNNIDELRAIVAKHGKDLAAIVMEPMRYERPMAGFLESVRDVARQCGAVLIFDEITSGWRYRLGGVHMDLGVSPDLAVFAKAISNGYPMAAIIGRSDVMQAAQGSFISSTYWTDRIGPTAALAAIEKMRRIDLGAKLRRAGTLVQEGWKRLADKHQLQIEIHGQPALCSFALQYGQTSQALRTLFTQVMLDRGFIASAGFYACAAHGESEIEAYLGAVDEAFAAVKSATVKGDIMQQLRGPVAQSGFQRLT